MKKNKKRTRDNKGASLFLSIVLVFCILGTVVFFVAQRISSEMSSSAIHNLSESLGLIKGTVEAILTKEAEFQKLIAREISTIEDQESFIRSYEKNRTMVKISLIPSGENQGISNSEEVFTENGLDFSSGRTVEDLPISQSYLNGMGTWAYTMTCPVVKD